MFVAGAKAADTHAADTHAADTHAAHTHAAHTHAADIGPIRVLRHFRYGRQLKRFQHRGYFRWVH